MKLAGPPCVLVAFTRIPIPTRIHPAAHAPPVPKGDPPHYRIARKSFSPTATVSAGALGPSLPLQNQIPVRPNQAANLTSAQSPASSHLNLHRRHHSSHLCLPLPSQCLSRLRPPHRRSRLQQGWGWLSRARFRLRPVPNSSTRDSVPCRSHEGSTHLTCHLKPRVCARVEGQLTSPVWRVRYDRGRRERET